MGSAGAEATSSNDVPGDDERAEASDTMQPKGNGREESEEQVPNGERVEMGDNEIFEADADEETRLKQLATSMDQDDLERNIGRQADQLLTEQADERDNKRLEKTKTNKQRLVAQLSKAEQRLGQPGGSLVKNRIRAETANLQAQIDSLDTEVEQIQQRIDDRHKDGAQEGETLLEEAGNRRLPGESRRDFLIRTGKITPFSKMPSLARASSSLADVMLEAEAEEGDQDASDAEPTDAAEPMSHRHLMAPGFMDVDTSDGASATDFPSGRPTKRRRLQTKREARATLDAEAHTDADSVGDDSEDAFMPDMTDQELAAVGESEDEEVDEDANGDFPLDTTGRKRKASSRKKKADLMTEQEEDLTGVDDGDEQVYQARLRSWVKRRSEARRKALAKKTQSAAEAGDHTDDRDLIAAPDGDIQPEGAEWYRSHPTLPDTEFEGGYRLPGDIYPSLFDYQKTGVRWLWELYSQQVGGIIGDEMGLGKTVQIISFLAGLHHSKMLTKPIVVVTPATVMKQWVNEFHRWWPPLRVSILHTSGSGMMDVRRERQIEDELESRVWSDSKKRLTKGEKAAKKIVDRVVREGHVLVTTYSGLQTYADLLIPLDWEYAVLDEGHKIRNPNTAITIYCKELRTANRVILSGTPMQNNLTELWSLFDFVFPMRLGTLVNFRQQFEFPIKQGGYANASNLQVETAMKCAETLKDTISAYLLQRFKVDVAADLPKKTERVLFCKLTKLQREAYENFLASEEMKSILNGRRQVLYGVDILRKICNHPDLAEHKTLSIKPGYNYGSGTKSGKMQVVKALLELWKKGGHKTLLFAQHRIMLDILEKFVKSMPGFKYRRMDGNTSIKDRQDLVDEFNKDQDLHVFLLTTKVGGLGVNLTGADRVIIYDPDWNPSTDVQARERAWRLGQKRDVEIYRLMTAGTIEEKIYHRQIFKQFLTNKILRDPKQRQTFQLRDLHDLFTLGESNDGQTETGSLFKGAEVQFSDKQSNEKEPNAPASSTEVHAAQNRPNAPSSDRLDTITGVSRQEDYNPNGASESTNPSEQKDDPLLSTIFARAGVQSALEHDAILGSNSGKPKIRADPEIIAREAKRVAAEAARELQRAGEIARTVPVGTPTWTGIVGTAGRPEERPRNGVGAGAVRGGRGGGGAGRGGPSSASVLANLAARQGGGVLSSNASSRASTPQAQQHQPKGREWMALIRDYLLAHGGKVYTQMLIDHFNRYCGTPQRTAEFKEMLKKIATLERGVGGRGKWVLRDEFRRRS